MIDDSDMGSTLRAGVWGDVSQLFLMMVMMLMKMMTMTTMTTLMFMTMTLF
jgi:hypothetical protein